MSDKEALQLLAEIDEKAEGLTDWEIGFVSSLLYEASFTDKQKQKIGQIYSKYVK